MRILPESADGPYQAHRAEVAGGNTLGVRGHLDVALAPVRPAAHLPERPAKRIRVSGPRI